MSAKKTTEKAGGLTPEQREKVARIIKRADDLSKTKSAALSFSKMLVGRLRIDAGPGKISNWGKYSDSLLDAFARMENIATESRILDRAPGEYEKEYREDAGQTLSSEERADDAESCWIETREYLRVAMALFKAYAEAVAKNPLSEAGIEQAVEKQLSRFMADKTLARKSGRPRKDRRTPYPKKLMGDWLREFFQKNPRAAPNAAVAKALELFDEETGDPAYKTYRPPWGARRFWVHAAKMRTEITGKRSRK